MPASVQEPGSAVFRSRRSRRWPAPLRWLAIAISITGGLAVCGLVAGILFVARLEKGPILVEGLGQRIAERLQQRFGADQVFRLGDTMIEKGEHGPELTISGFSISGTGGDIILAAPKARVTLDPLALVFGDVTPRRLDVVGLELRLSVMPDGALAVTAGDKPMVLRAPQAPVEETPAAVAAPPPAVSPPAPPAPGEPEQAGGAGPQNEAASPTAAIPSPQEKSARDAMRPTAEALRQLLSVATGKGSPLGALGQFGIVQGKLIFDDKVSGKETVFDGLQVQFERSPGQAKLLASVNGPNGRWQMAVTAANEAGEGVDVARTLEVEFSNLTLDEITLFSGLRDLPFDTDMPIRVKIRIGAGTDGEFRMAQGSFGLGAGYLSFRDPDQEPLLLERVSGSFRWQDDARKFVIEPTQVEGAEARLVIGGEVLPPQSNNGRWAISLANIGDALIGAERPGQALLILSKLELAAVLDPAGRTIDVPNFTLQGPQVDLRGSANFAITPEGRLLKLRVNGEKMPVAALLRLWPSASGPAIRAWLVRNLKSGMVSKGSLAMNYGEEAFAAILARRPVPDDNLRLEFDIQDAVLNYLQGVQPARGLSGAGLVTGKTSRFNIAHGIVDGGGRQIALTGGSFTFTNLAPEASPASVTVNLSGGVDTLAAVLAEPGLKQHAALVLDPATLKGRVEGKLTVDFKLGQKASAADTRVRAQANATNVSIEKLMGKERLEGATIQFTVDGKELSAKGNGRMFGAPATFSFEKEGKNDIQAVMSLVLDDQARQKLGWSTGSRLTGPVSMKVSGPLGRAEALHGNVEFDLTRASIADIAPGLGKPAGRPARASFNLAHRNEGTTLQNFNYQAGSTSARGTIELDKKGAFVSANLSSLKLSPGDELAGEISAAAGNLQVKLHGPVIDMRPFIQAMTSPGAGSGEGPGDPANRFDVDLQTKLATGYNRQALADFSIKLTRQAGRFQRFELAARTGRTSVRGRLTPGTSRVEVTAGDGGAIMSFLDLYRRMEGGLLTLTANVTATRVDGLLNVQNFVLRDEPALRRLVAEGTPRTDGEGRTRIDPSLVNFDRLRLNFSKENGRIQLHDGVINGPQIGTTLEGVVDFPRDQVNMKGTFVPAYGLNNMFAKIPLFGPILGGGRNEGLVGVNYSVTGKASAPFLNVNPLSAITPGFLRKIFGAIGNADTAEAPEAKRPQMPLSLNPGR